MKRSPEANSTLYRFGSHLGLTLEKHCGQSRLHHSLHHHHHHHYHQKHKRKRETWYEVVLVSGARILGRSWVYCVDEVSAILAVWASPLKFRFFTTFIDYTAQLKSGSHLLFSDWSENKSNVFSSQYHQRCSYPTQA